MRGQIPPIPNHYSDQLKELVAEMLTKEPQKRPNIDDILEKDVTVEGKDRADLQGLLSGGKCEGGSIGLVSVFGGDPANPFRHSRIDT